MALSWRDKMILVLDTSILIDIDRGNESTIFQLNALIDEFSNTEPAISWVSFFEFYYGTFQSEEGGGKSLEFLNKFSFLGMDKEATKIFTKFKKEKTNVKDFDLLIASVTIANNAILITKDSDFKIIKGLSYKIIE